MTTARLPVVLLVAILMTAACATESGTSTAGTGSTPAGRGGTPAGPGQTAGPGHTPAGPGQTPPGPGKASDPKLPELPRTELTISVDPGNRNPLRWTLLCDPPGGDHPLAAPACELLAKFAGQEVDPFAPPRKSRACTDLYGGPDTATVSGVWRGRRVQASFSRVDGCEIARWDALGPVLGGAGSR